MADLRSIPKVDKVLEWPELREPFGDRPREVVLSAIRGGLETLRLRLSAGDAGSSSLSRDTIISFILDELHRLELPRLRRVINGTGVVLHTNLGRSPLPSSLTSRIAEIAACYSNLEFDLETGRRGSRYSHVEPLLCELTGAEAALVVNNNAAAVLLALSALSLGKETVVSRGELVEIGGSFRIPDVMAQSGAILKEVGTTNRTHPDDYLRAIGPETALLLKVHTSNYAVVGFTAEVSAGELCTIGKKHHLPVMADLGSGSLVDLAPFGLPGEPTVQDFIAAGVDVVTFSGDKMLGGPQAGIIVGRRELIGAMKKHPLLRALRVDKMTFAALEEVLRMYRDPRRAIEAIPTLRMLTLTRDELLARGRSLARRIRSRKIPGLSVAVTEGASQVGGGAHPLLELPSALLSLALEGFSPDRIEERLRGMEVPVIGRIQRGSFILDVRTLLDDDIPLLLEQLSRLIP